ncbi:MAG: SRPBCC family protein [Solirubrobacterales bacterium]
MRSAQAKITIDRSPEEVFEYLFDYGSRAEFAPTIYRELRLARVESFGLGAGGRFRLHRKLRDRYAGTTVTEATTPDRILEEGSTGRSGRVGMAAELLLEELPGGGTRVFWIIETYPLNPADKLREFGMRRQIRRRMKSSLRRLRGILEGAPDAAPAGRPTVGGMDRNYVPNP